MSELEKLNREKHRVDRKKYIFIQQIALGALVLLLLIFSIAYFKLDKDTYVSYTQEGNAIHHAYLNDNTFYKEEYLNGSHAYVASLVKKMDADFSYKLRFATNKVKYKYSYKIDAQLQIMDNASSAPIWNPTEEIYQSETVSGVGNCIEFTHLVEDIDFQTYDSTAYAFLRKYYLSDTSTSSTLIYRMHVSVVGESEEFADKHSDEYVTELQIPLCKLTFKPVVTTTIPAGEQKILAISGNAKTFMGVFAIIFLVATIAEAVVFVLFIIKTRDKYIDYSRKVSKIRKNYKSYIQSISNAFDMTGARVLQLNTFDEMLEIRDTIQKPIMMYENPDQTCSQFFIVADYNIIYLHEIKVEKPAGDDGSSAAPALDTFAEKRKVNKRESKKDEARKKAVDKLVADKLAEVDKAAEQPADDQPAAEQQKAPKEKAQKNNAKKK